LVDPCIGAASGTCRAATQRAENERLTFVNSDVEYDWQYRRQQTAVQHF
jgi:hypothetical protein